MRQRHVPTADGRRSVCGMVTYRHPARARALMDRDVARRYPQNLVGGNACPACSYAFATAERTMGPPTAYYACRILGHLVMTWAPDAPPVVTARAYWSRAGFWRVEDGGVDTPADEYGRRVMKVTPRPAAPVSR